MCTVRALHSLTVSILAGDKIIIINFKRSGGVVGLRPQSVIDTDALTTKEAELVNKLVEEAGFFDLPAMPESPDRGADRFQYHINIADKSREHSITVYESSLPEKLKPLLEWLQKASRKKYS